METKKPKIDKFLDPYAEMIELAREVFYDEKERALQRIDRMRMHFAAVRDAKNEA